MKRYERGFTIIEVLLFLGISALLMVMAIATVGSSINSNRFNDAVRSMTSHLQGQYSEVASGLSDRSSARNCVSAGATTSGSKPPGMSNCVILGRFIKLEGDQFTSRYILGYGSALTNPSADDTVAINQMNPWVADTATYDSTYDVPWGIKVRDSTIPAAASPVPKLGLAIMRSPASGAIVFYAFPVTGPQPLLDASEGVIHTKYMNKEVAVCVTDATSGRSGVVRIIPGQGQEVIQTDLTDDGGAC